MDSFNDAIGSLMKIWDENDLYVEGSLKVLPQFCNKCIAVVATGRLAKAIPLYPPMEEGVAARLRRGLGHRDALVEAGGSANYGEQVLITMAFWERAHHIYMKVCKSCISS